MTTPQPRIAILPDTPDARLLVELTSHASDLSEASHTLMSAFEAGEGSELWLPLTSHAVTAYIRPFIHSNVRTRLDEMLEIPAIPPALKTVHDVIRQYRNTTIAHSQSDLTMPLPVALLDNAGHALNVAGVSIIHQMPMAIAERFADLIAAMEDVVDQATQPVLDRLRTWLNGEPPETISDWADPEFTTQSTRISVLQEKEDGHLVLRAIGTWSPCHTTSPSKTDAGPLTPGEWGGGRRSSVPSIEALAPGQLRPGPTRSIMVSVAN